jgi:hypothetical protein
MVVSYLYGQFAILTKSFLVRATNPFRSWEKYEEWRRRLDRPVAKSPAKPLAEPVAQQSFTKDVLDFMKGGGAASAGASVSTDAAEPQVFS